MVGSSFTDWQLLSKQSFIGLNNYLKIFSEDGTFYKAALNTIIWVVLQATVHVAIGVTLALILSKKEFYWKFVRTVYFIPNIISGAALGMLYLTITNPQYGMINSLIKNIGFRNFDHNWFFDYNTAFFTVTMTWLPYAAVVTILCLAEISSIPDSLIESAKIDGAGSIRIDLSIVLPMLRNIVGTCVIIAATSMLQNFATIYMTTNGGPDIETTNLPLYIYKVSMLENNYGYANALGTLVTIMGVAIILIIQRSFRMGQSDL